MRMLLHRLPQIIRRHLGALVQEGLLNTGDIVLRWNASAAPADRNLEATYAPPTPAELTVKAFIHWVSVRAVERGFTDFKAGDAIVTFESDVELDNKRDLRFEMPGGEIYVQASAGKSVAQFWDVYIGGEMLTRTLLLRLKT